MFGLSNLRVTWKLRMLIGFAVVALGVFAWVSFSTLRTVEINGAAYQDIKRGLDSIGDINPPVVNLLQSRLQVYLIINETDRAKRETEVAQLHQFRKDFEQMLEENTKHLGESEGERKIKNLSMGDVRQTAVEYWDQVDQGLLPLLQ